MKLDNIAAIVTGGASGLGGATASALAAAGAKVTIIDLNEELGTVKAQELGGRFAKVDVTDEDGVIAALDAAQEAHGIARVLVNCAGIGIPGRTVDRKGNAYSLARFRRVVEVNLIGTFNMISKVAERLVPADLIGEERGVIVNTASVAAFEGQIGQCSYSASKGGIVAMTLPIARDLAHSAIRVVTVAPGIFMTPILGILPQEAIDALGKQIPFPPRLGQPNEFAQLVESVILNPMLNGETIRLDGAIRMPPR